MKLSRRNSVLMVNNIRKYSDRKTGWPIYSLLLEPLPVLAIRNLNYYDEKNEWHSTLSWKPNKELDRAIRLSCSILQPWNAFRTRKRGAQVRLVNRIRKKLPKIIETFERKIHKMGIRRMRAIRPTDRRYNRFLVAVAEAVTQASFIKGVDNPMMGSKLLHFLIPEFFPVWDTAWVKKCLSKEQLPNIPSNVSRQFLSRAAKSYARYVHLLVVELSMLKRNDYVRLERSCLNRSLYQYKWYYNKLKNVLDWHYDDLSTTVFEICLLGKNC